MSQSYSALKLYEQCPRQYYETRILQRFPRAATEATIWGHRVHEAAEEYIRDGKPFGFEFPGSDMVEALAKLSGEKHCEMTLAVNDKLEPVDFDDPTAMLRGVADLVIVKGSRIRVCDYKTGGSKYPDVSQLELMALMLFAALPEVGHSMNALLFLAHNTIVPSITKRENARSLWVGWINKVHRIENAMEHNVWNPKPSGLCPWCPVTECEYWHEKRRK